MPNPNKIQKIPCQPIRSVNSPPTIGAATGATPLIAPITANILASSRPENLSVATEREITMPPAPAIPCSRRKATNCSMLRENRHSSVEAMNNQQRQTASVAVAQRAKEHLPHRQTNHTGRQSQLYHRRSGTEIIAHRGQAGQIHVGDERTESGQHAQQYQQEYFGIFFYHTIYISLKSVAKLP